MTTTQPTAQSGAATKLARETMTGDLRDCVLDFLKHDKNPLPWNMQTAEQQTASIAKVTKAVEASVQKAVTLIAADGKTFIRGKLIKLQIKDGIQVQVNMSKTDPLRHQLIDSQGEELLIVLAGTMAYQGERKSAKPDPDQRTFIDDEAEGE